MFLQLTSALSFLSTQSDPVSGAQTCPMCKDDEELFPWIRHKMYRSRARLLLHMSTNHPDGAGHVTNCAKSEEDSDG
jgi:hypothetical protein